MKDTNTNVATLPSIRWIALLSFEMKCTCIQHITGGINYEEHLSIITQSMHGCILLVSFTFSEDEQKVASYQNTGWNRNYIS